jgi:hypothetical protein
MKCSVCGNEHSLDELELTFKRPDALAVLSEAERNSRCRESADLAHIDHTRWFVRGTIPLGVHGRLREYRIGAWVEVEESEFRTVLDLWDDPSQSDRAALPAVLANHIPGHAESLGQPVSLKLTGPETRPDILISDVSTSLGAEQVDGISEERAMRYSSHTYHDDSDCRT